MVDFSRRIDREYETKSIAELADAPVESIEGLSASDAEHLRAAFNIKTVRDLGTNKFFRWAQAIANLSD